jgi:hypothetical protein
MIEGVSERPQTEGGHVMPAVNKVQTQLLVSPHIRTRVQALAIVRQEAAAEVYRILIEAQLPAMERGHAEAIGELHRALTYQKVHFADALDTMISQKVKYEDLWLPDGSPRARFPGKF